MKQRIIELQQELALLIGERGNDGSCRDVAPRNEAEPAEAARKEQDEVQERECHGRQKEEDGGALAGLHARSGI